MSIREIEKNSKEMISIMKEQGIFVESEYTEIINKYKGIYMHGEIAKMFASATLRQPVPESKYDWMN